MSCFLFLRYKYADRKCQNLQLCRYALYQKRNKSVAFYQLPLVFSAYFNVVCNTDSTEKEIIVHTIMIRGVLAST